MVIAHRVEDRGNQDQQSDPRLLPPQRVRHAARVALDRPGARERGAGIAHRRDHVERDDPLQQRRALAAQVRPAREDQLVGRLLDPEARGIDDELAARRQPRVVGDREERDAVERDLLEPGIRVEDAVEQQVAALVGASASAPPPRNFKAEAARCSLVAGGAVGRRHRVPARVRQLGRQQDRGN